MEKIGDILPRWFDWKQKQWEKYEKEEAQEEVEE